MPMQLLTTWMSALCPQNMLEQLLIHQPKDPIPFMIKHLQQDNDNGEPLGLLPLPLLLLDSYQPLCPLCLGAGAGQGGEGF